MGRVLAVAAVLAVLLAGALLLRRGSSAPGPGAPGGRPPIVPPTAPQARPAPPPEAPAAGADLAPPADPAAGAVLAITGRVVDGRRFPVAGVVARYNPPEGPDLAVRTDEAGRFRIEGVPVPGVDTPAAILVIREPGLAAIGRPFLRAGSAGVVDAGILVLEPSVPLDVRVEDGNVPVAGARVVIGWEWSTPLHAVTAADGLARFPAVPRRVVRVVASTGSPERVGVASPVLQAEPPRPLVVALVPGRTIEVAAVESGTGRPVPGATFVIHRQVRMPGTIMNLPPDALEAVPPTGADGRTRIRGTHPEDTLVLGEPAAPGWIPVHSRQRAVVPVGATEARLEFLPGRTLRIPVTDREGPVPPDGAAIAVEAVPGSRQPQPGGPCRMEGAELVVENAPTGVVHAVAVAPDRGRATFSADDKGSPPQEVSFRPARKVTVNVRRPDGTPAAGIHFQLRNQGNQPLGPPFASDEAGRASMGDLYAGLVEVYRIPEPADPWNGTAIGSVHLGGGDSVLEHVLPPARRVLVRVTLDGVPGIPGKFSAFLGPLSPRTLSEDPVKGEILWEVLLPAGTPFLFVNASGAPYPPVRATVKPIPEEDPVVVVLPFVTGGAIHAAVTPPADGRYALALRKWDEEMSLWAAHLLPGAMAMDAVADPDGILRAEPLPAGSYRIVEKVTGLESETLVVPAGGEPVRCALDLSRGGPVRGKVLLPEGERWTDVRILVEGPGIPPRSTAGPSDLPAARVAADGTFEVPVPGDRTVRILPWHPHLVPAADGIAEATGPRDGVVLRLEKGATATVRVDPTPPARSWDGVAARALLFRGPPEGEPDVERPCTVAGNRVTFGGFPAGTWTVLLDCPGLEGGAARAPAVLDRVVFGAGHTDLEPVRLPEGTRVRVTVRVKEGAAVPRISLTAVREGKPTYARTASSGGESEVTLAGLGPGRFRITALPVMGAAGGRMIQEVREVGGTGTIDFELDLR